MVGCLKAPASAGAFFVPCTIDAARHDQIYNGPPLCCKAREGLLFGVLSAHKHENGLQLAQDPPQEPFGDNNRPVFAFILGVEHARWPSSQVARPGASPGNASSPGPSGAGELRPGASPVAGSPSAATGDSPGVRCTSRTSSPPATPAAEAYGSPPAPCRTARLDPGQPGSHAPSPASRPPARIPAFYRFSCFLGFLKKMRCARAFSADVQRELHPAAHRVVASQTPTPKAYRPWRRLACRSKTRRTRILSPSCLRTGTNVYREESESPYGIG